MAEAFEEFAEEPDDRLTVKPGELRDGEELCVKITDSPDVFDSDQYGRGFSLPALFVSADITFHGEDGDEIGGGDEINVVSWSKRLARALRRYADEHGYEGEVVISKEGADMKAQYEVEPAGEGDE